MLIGALIAGLVLGLLAGGHLFNLANVRLRFVQALFLGLFLRYATELAIDAGNAPADALRLPLFLVGFVLLLAGLWANREHPGISIAFVGILLNAIALTVNGGWMPVWEPSVLAAGLPLDTLASSFHTIITPVPGVAIPSDFLLRAGPLGDIIPIPVPGLRNVASIGDVFLAGGLAFFLFATVVRRAEELDEIAQEMIRRRLAGLGGGAVGDAALGGEMDGGLVATVALEPAVALGGASFGSGSALAAEVGMVGEAPAFPAAPGLLDRARRHPYVRLALDSSFSALWTGQLISLVGDRVHQVALAFVVLRATGSPIAVGAVFLVGTLPNLLFGPIAGTLVDRWDQREVMIVSDLLRAGLVLLIPIAAVTDLVLVYPLVFLVTTVSIFFRPAKGAVLPRMVAQDDLVAANSALWVGETFADIGGYVLAGLFVALLGSQLPLAFWVDAVTYVGSAVLIASITVTPLIRRAAGDGETVDEIGGLRGLGVELRDGWRFLRRETVVLANTLQAVVGQFMLGTFLALTPIYAAQQPQRYGFDDATAYSFLEGAIGAGNLIGGFLIGLIGSRIALGRMVILGYAVTGAAVAGLALTGNLVVAIGLCFGAGVGNLAFVIPSQTIVQTRTPANLMGRVLGLRFSLVVGSMTLAMGIGGVLGQVFGAGPVIGVFGLVTVAAGLGGLLVPAVRNA